MKKDIQIWRSKEQEIVPGYAILLPRLTQIFVVGEKLFGLSLRWEIFRINLEFLLMTLFQCVKHVDIYPGYNVGPKNDY